MLYVNNYAADLLCGSDPDLFLLAAKIPHNSGSIFPKLSTHLAHTYSHIEESPRRPDHRKFGPIVPSQRLIYSSV
jgi:hypothetical protein